VNYKLIAPATEAGKAIYKTMSRLIEKFHEELTNAKIALAWNKGWKANVDGQKTLGKTKKASDLDRELAAFDFVIILNQEFWEDPKTKDEQRDALLDHELCHCAVREDKDGEPMRDERGRTVYRLRKHDVEEFSEVVRRHGIWKRDIEHFASSLKSGKQTSLLEPEEPEAEQPLPAPKASTLHAVAAKGH